MGLLDLKTDLKSLKYGNDQRGGGSSNQPYIVTPIPDGYADIAADFLLRNGRLNPESSFQDVSRLTKFFLDTKSPNGLLFTAKQELLERQNPIQANTDRIYNPFNTITQAGIVSIGGHLNKQGLDPFVPGYYVGGRDGYYFSTLAGANVDGGENGGENRLALLYTSKVADQSLGTYIINPFGVTGPNDQVNLLSYQGGPNSVLGFGTTNIKIQNPTRVVVPKENAKWTKITSETLPNYLSPIGKPAITWNYNPSEENNLSNQYIITIGESNDIIYTDNVVNVLNRDTSTIIPIGKEANTFVKSQSTLKSEPTKYLVTGDIKGNIVWDYNITAAVSGASSVYYNLSSTPISTYHDLFDKELGKENYILPKPSFSNNFKGSYGKLKSSGNDQVQVNPSIFTTASKEYEKITGKEINDTVLNNIQQKSPKPYWVEDTLVKGLIKTGQENTTTTLSSLNPQYFTLNKNNTVSSEKAIDTIGEFNREKTYGTLTTNYAIVDGDGKPLTKATINANPNATFSSDKVNQSDVLQPTDSQVKDLKQQDLVKFYFEINNNNTLTDTQNFFLFFRAYLNDLGDSYKPDWQSYKYIGRAENFYKYGGFSRDISLGFTIYAHSRVEMAPIYKKLNYLVGTTAPDYSDAGYMRGNFVNLTVGDYLNNVPGIIQSINLKPSFDAGWDIDRDRDSNPLNDKLQLPRMIEVDLQFTPIHTFTPKFGSPFISNFV